MNEFVTVYVVVSVLSLALLYVLIRVGVKHGARSALREHEVWMRDGSLEAALTAREGRAEFQARLDQNDATRRARV
jgi:hypothetical protein